MHHIVLHPLSTPAGTGADIDFRQLRHQTKNALARIMLQLSEQLRSGCEATRLATELERRIMLTARISDALFGLTLAPPPLPRRLQDLATNMLDLLGDPEQQIELEVTTGAGVPEAFDGVILRVAHEFLGNALKHGMHMRLCGRIQVQVVTDMNSVTLEVTDDGWGATGKAAAGEGLVVARHLASSCGGTVSLRRQDGFTIATLRLPEP